MLYCIVIEYKLITEKDTKDSLISQGYTMEFPKAMAKRKIIPRYSLELPAKSKKHIGTDKLPHPCRDDIPYRIENFEVKRRVLEEAFTNSSEGPIIKNCMKKTKKGEVPAQAWTEIYNFDDETIVERYYIT